MDSKGFWGPVRRGGVALIAISVATVGLVPSAQHEKPNFQSRVTQSPVPVIRFVDPSIDARSWRAGCLARPVPGPVISTFQAPDCPYCAGRRTIDFGVVVGDEVRSPVAGRVIFAGIVAGIGYVTVAPFAASSHLVTVGGLVVSNALDTEIVDLGEIVGTAQGSAVISLSVRLVHASGLKSYVDPEPLLARWRVRSRLVPLSGSAPRPVQPIYGCRLLGSEP